MFIDYSKAFNSISHVQIFEILSEMGFPKQLFALLELSSFNDQLRQVLHSPLREELGKVERGVKQG